MNEKVLGQLGLTKSQAKAYLALIRAGRLTPPELAEKIDESRTAAYMALAKLEEIGLAHKLEESKKLMYAPANPSELDKFLQKRRQSLTQAENLYRQALPSMLTYFYTFRDEPGVRYYHGEDGIKSILIDQLRTGEDVLVIRTTADDQYGEILFRYLEKRAEAGIANETIGPYSRDFYEFARNNDSKLKRKVTLLPPKDYTAPVEISVYGNKVSFVSFNEETMAVVIDSPQIAEAMRQVFKVMKVGAQTLFEPYGKAYRIKQLD